MQNPPGQLGVVGNITSEAAKQYTMNVSKHVTFFMPVNVISRCIVLLVVHCIVPLHRRPADDALVVGQLRSVVCCTTSITS